MEPVAREAPAGGARALTVRRLVFVLAATFLLAVGRAAAQRAPRTPDAIEQA